MKGPLPYTRQNATGSSIASDNASHVAGKIIITTGVSPKSTGALFVEEIAKHNPALLILAGRNLQKTQATASKVASINPSVKTRVLVLDLASQDSVRRAAAEVCNYQEDHIDVLVNNAGVMAGPYKTTAEGIELHFGANHVGHFLFTNLIMGKVLAASNPRIINISSDLQRLSPIRFNDYNFSGGKTYNQWIAYAQSKSANILFSQALASFASLNSQGLRTFSVHPGVLMSTNLGEGLGPDDFADLQRLHKEIGDPLGDEGASLDVKTEDEMIATHVAAAFDPRLGADEWNGAYMADGNVTEEDMDRAAGSWKDAERLWTLSEDLVGQAFKY